MTASSRWHIDGLCSVKTSFRTPISPLCTGSLRAFERYNVEYERAEFCYALSNRIIADATMGVFASWFPAPLRPLVEPCIHAMLDEPVLDAFGSHEVRRAGGRGVQPRALGHVLGRGQCL